jgi:hypothetical protein
MSVLSALLAKINSVTSPNIFNWCKAATTSIDDHEKRLAALEKRRGTFGG